MVGQKKVHLSRLLSSVWKDMEKVFNKDFVKLIDNPRPSTALLRIDVEGDTRRARGKPPEGLAN